MEPWVLTVVLFVVGTVLTIFGFFLRTAYLDARKDIELLIDSDHKRTEELGRLKGKIELVQQAVYDDNGNRRACSEGGAIHAQSWTAHKIARV